jgi:hypothetical protein
MGLDAMVRVETRRDAPRVPPWRDRARVAQIIYYMRHLASWGGAKPSLKDTFLAYGSLSLQSAREFGRLSSDTVET